MVINWNGQVLPCCYDQYEKYKLGNVFKEGLKKVWNNQEYIKFRKIVLKNQKSIPMCDTCTINISEEISKEEKINYGKDK